MYHQVTLENSSQVDPKWTEHMRFLASSEKYQIIIPREKLSQKKLNLCLTFDDATADFYFHVFPLIKKFNIKVVLAVPAGLIPERTNLSPEDRMKIKDLWIPDALCTWPELKEMADSGLVQMASHGMNHQSFRNKNLDFLLEAQESKKLLEKKLGIEIKTFVYPYGQDAREAHQKLVKIYQTIMRVGHAVNFSWERLGSMHYRVSADKYWKLGLRPKVTVGLIFKRIKCFFRF